MRVILLVLILVYFGPFLVVVLGQEVLGTDATRALPEAFRYAFRVIYWPLFQLAKCLVRWAYRAYRRLQ